MTFQQGDGKGAVSDTDDAGLDSSVPTTNLGTDLFCSIDRNTHQHCVMKFPGIVGNGPNQIPPGSLITSASLTLYIVDGGTDCPTVHQLDEDWTESEATWNDRMTGVPWTAAGADVGSHRALPNPSFPCVTTGSFGSADVTVSVQNWVNGELNAGWAIVDANNNDGIDIRTSEGATPAERPLLTVTYLPHVYYSIGTNASDLKSGSPNITIASGVATLTASQTNDVGVGDVIDNGTELVYITEVVSDTQFMVQAGDGAAATDVADVPVVSIKRAFNSVASAVSGSTDGSHLGTSDLTAAGRRLVWVLYDDAPFSVGATTTINGYVTDSTHYITLTVAGASQVATGNSQRHTGVAETGVRFEASGGGGMTFLSVSEAYTQIEWVELDGNDITTVEGILLSTSADNSLVRNVIIHHLDGTPGSETVTSSGIFIDSGNDASEVHNSIVYAYDGDGVHVSGTNAVIANSSFYLGRTSPSSNSVQTDTGATADVYNVLAVGPETDFWENDAPGLSLYNCISEDNSAQTFDVSGNFKIGVNETSEFVSIAGNIDLHLRPGAEAIDFGVDLSASFVDDIDDDTRPLASAWDVGADETAFSSATARYSSIGTNPGNLHAVGMASVPVGSTTVTFTSPLPAQTAVGAVGTGDVLVIEGETLFIASYDSPTQVTLQSAATVDHSTPTSSFTVTRAFNTLQAWEDARDGNLVGEDRIEVGVAYKDSPFMETLTIDDSTTDATHFMRLTVAVGQRHDGTAGTGVVLDGQSADRMGIEILDDYSVVEWFDLTNHHGVTGFPSVRVNAATNVLVQFLLVRDFFDAAGNSEGVAMRQGQINGMTVRNSIIYNGDAVGIEGDDGDDTLVIENCTIYNMDGNGVDEKNGTVISATNTISMGNTGLDFDMPSGTQSYNMSDDGTASCGTCKPTENPLIQFQTLGSDLHLAGTSTAIDAGTDLSGSFCCDIDAGARPAGAQWDMGADELGAVTAVELVSFEAEGADGAVELAWTTGSELNNLGFHLHRAVDVSGPYARITARAIPGLGSSPAGADYGYRDTGLTNGETYYYKLEDIETTGSTTLHGPIAATPRAGVPLAGAEDASVLITYGRPAANALRVIERGRSGVTLELLTEGFYAEPLDDGTVRLEVPGFEALMVPNAPGLPVRRAWVDAVTGRNVEVQSIRYHEVEAFSGLRPAGAETAELEASLDGTVRARRTRREGSRGTRAVLQGGGLYPSEAASVESVGFQGETKKALVVLAPVRWDASAGQLLLARRLIVRVSFHGREASERGRAGQRRRKRGERVIARLATRNPGLYGVRFEEVFSRRGQARASSTLKLSRQGDAVAFHVEPLPSRFGPGSVLYFVSDGAAANLYGSEAVYELEQAQSGLTMEPVDGSPAGKAVSRYWHTVRLEQNRYYQPALVDAPDRWLWELVMAPGSKSFPFFTEALASSDEPSRLSVWLQGASDLPASPDHHVRVFLNGYLVAEASWDGKTLHRIDAELAPGVVVNGENVLELENAGDTDAEYSMVMLDRFEVLYPRFAEARAGSLEGVWSRSGTAEVSGLSQKALVLDTSFAAPRWLSGAQMSADGTLRFRVESHRRYLVVGASDVPRPVITRPAAEKLVSERNGADYIVIAPETFLPAAEPLLELRRRQGLRVKAVAIEAVYSEFGFGESTPEAVRSFLSHAFHRWQKPSPRYVLLLGDATYDFKNYLETGVQNHVPPRMTKTSYLWTASDPSYATVNGDDILPDFAIGRLPAASLDEARGMVQKIVTYEADSVGVTRAPIVLVADVPDSAGNFEADAERLATGPLASRSVRKIYVDELGAPASRASILDAFDEGASIVSYVGHGGIHLWSSKNVFNIGDVTSMRPQAQQPMLLTMNCLNGYFHFPYFDSLAEGLLKAEGKGAIAAFSPSGLSLNGPAHRYHHALLNELLSNGHRRLGDAVVAAQERYLETGSFPELLSIYHLFGDPATTLR